MGIAELIIMAMEKEGLPHEQCIKKIWMVDSKGLIVKVRSSLKARFLHLVLTFKHHVVCIGVYSLFLFSHVNRFSLEFLKTDTASRGFYFKLNGIVH